MWHKNTNPYKNKTCALPEYKKSRTVVNMIGTIDSMKGMSTTD